MIPLTISQISEVISGKIVGDGNKLITGAAFSIPEKLFQMAFS